MDFDSRPASDVQRKVVAGLSAVMLTTGAAVLPFAGHLLPAVPSVSGIYAAASSAIDLATFLLLVASPRNQRASHVIAGAFLFAGILAFMHLLTFPGAVVPDRPLVGNGNAVGWLFNAWHAGFPIGVLSAVVLQRSDSSLGRGSYRPELFALAAASAITLVSLNLTASPYTPASTGVHFSMLSAALSYACAAVSLAAVLLIYRSGLAHRSLFLWVSLVLVADTVGLIIGTAGGARYTVGWYGWRIEGTCASLIVLAVLSSHFRSIQSELVATVANLRARTDALQAEIQRREHAERLLLQAQKLEAVGQLAAGLAHDFNNLMQVVVARLEILRKRVGLQAEGDAQAIRHAIGKAEGLTRQLMLFTGRRQASPTSVSLQQTLPTLVAMLRPLLRSDVEIELDLQTDLAPIFVDRDEFEVALTNIVANARDAMPRGGRVRVVADGALVGAASKGGMVRLRIEDNGTGIPREVIDRVFEPFFSTKQPGKGAGLGLSQVYAFARSSDGSVDVSSMPGLGTTITLRLPAAKSSDSPRTAPEVASPTPQASGCTILLVDDSRDVLESTTMLLEHAGYTVSSASSAQEALQLLDGGLVPNVLLSDIVMPGEMDGLALAREIARRLPSTKRVLASGSSVASDLARQEGLTVLQKPYALNDLMRALESI